MRSHHSLLTALAVVLLLMAPAESLAAAEPQRETITAMGGIPINISAWGLEAEAFQTAVAAIDKRIQQLEAMISTYRPDSAVSQLNRGEALPDCPPDLAYLARTAADISLATGGTFDITVKPLVELWRSCRREQRLPATAEYEAALKLVGFDQVHIAANGGISFTAPGVMLDFGGIAKGYFADEAVRILRRAGATRCLVDCGGDITGWQAGPAGEQPFRVGIRDPQGGKDIFAVLEVPAGAVVTSGDYERFYEIDGHRYCHIFDPRTGRPVENTLSVTLAAPTGIEADAYATAVFVMGLENGARFIDSHDHLEAVIVSRGADGELEVYVSSGMLANIEFAAAGR